MFNNKKYNIEDFYIGELYIGDLGLYSATIVVDTIQNGAIDIQDRLLIKHYDKDRHRYYDILLTIFHKYNNEYTCLHNGKTYTQEGTDYCKSLISLKDLLPKVSYNIPEYLSFKEPYHIFDKLFKNRKAQKIANSHNKTPYDINDFYTGNLNLYEGFILEESGSHYPYTYYNLPELRILFESDAKVKVGNYLEIFNEQDNTSKTHNYLVCNCLFLKFQGENLYNINNFQTYNKGVLSNEQLTEFKIGESYYDHMVPFTETLKEQEVKYDKEKITIPKALKLYKKIK